MVDTIGVAVRDAPPRQRIRALAVHGAGLALGALLVGLSLALVATATGRLDLETRPVVQAGLAVLAVGWAVSALGRRGIPFPRRRWQVPERWRFALSCVPAALFPPRRARRAASTPAPLRRLAAPPALVLGGLGIAAVVYLVIRYWQPGPVGVTPVHDPVVLSLSALGFGAVVWLAVATPGTLGTDKEAFQVGLGTGLAMGLLTFAAGPFPILLGVVFLPWVTVTVAAVRHSFRSGVRTAVWASVFTTLAGIPAFVVGALISFARDGEIWYGDGVQRAGIIDEMAGWVVPWTIGVLLPVMVVGAALGAVLASPGRRARLAS